MRTRAQASLCNEAQESSGKGTIKKFRVKVSNGASAEKTDSRRKEELKVLVKRKAFAAASPDQSVETSPPVIKKHKRGLNRQRLAEESGGKDLVQSEHQSRSPKVRADSSVAETSEDLLGDNRNKDDLSQARISPPRTGCDQKLTKVAKASGGPVCTVNTEMVNEVYGLANPSVNRSELSEASCSTSSAAKDDRDGSQPSIEVPEQPKATRTPICFPVPASGEATVPAKRSPLPLPSAVRSALPPAPPAVRSALPVPPAVRSALPLPQTDPALENEDCADEQVLANEVDIHGFSSAITGTGMQFQRDGFNEQSSDDDGSPLDGNVWLDDGTGLSELRRRSGGPGSRATYRCSRCLAPKKGHRCPFESEENKDDANAESMPKLLHKRPGDATSIELPGKLHKCAEDDDKSVNEQLSDISKQEDDCSSPYKPESTPGCSKLEDTKSARESLSKAKSPSEFVVKEFAVSAKWLLETGVLEGHKVRYMPRAGEVLGSGLVQSGVILCSCRQCKGFQGFNASSFEKHVGSTARHPSDFIFLDNGRCLREILEDGSRFKDKPAMLNALRVAVSLDWDAGCAKCGEGGDLVVRCSGQGCFNGYHRDCAGIAASRMKAWQCSDCNPIQETSSRNPLGPASGPSRLKQKNRES